VITAPDVVIVEEDELAIEELELLFDELELLLISELVTALEELVAGAEELVVTGVLLEPLPPPPQADIKRLRVNKETKLRLRIYDSTYFYDKNYRCGQLHHKQMWLVYMLPRSEV